MNVNAHTLYIQVKTKNSTKITTFTQCSYKTMMHTNDTYYIKPTTNSTASK